MTSRPMMFAARGGWVTAVIAFGCQVWAQPALLPGTSPLTWPEADLSGRLMDGAHAFVERKMAEAAPKRGVYWRRDFSSPAAYEKSVDANRARFAHIVGVVDPRLPPALERYGDAAQPSLIEETAGYRVHQVRWPVLDGLWGAGLWVEPKGTIHAGVVIVPDADQSPEGVLASGAIRQLAAAGVELIIPTTISRAKIATNDVALKRSDQTYREWIYRQAFHMGRHVIGYEVQTALAAIDGMRARRSDRVKIAITGYGEGGLVAFYAAALDSRIESALISGYFGSRESVWAEPIYRNVWSLLREFGDAEIASLILPRKLMVEASPGPVVTGHKGDLKPAEVPLVAAEFGRIPALPAGAAPLFIRGDAAYSPAAVAEFARALGVTLGPGNPYRAEVPAAGATVRHERYFREMEAHVQRLVRDADHVRDRHFLLSVLPELGEAKWSTARRHPTYPVDKFVAGARAFRARFQEEGMGRFDEQLRPFNTRTRQVAATPKWTAYDVILDVFPELISWGLLVIPTDLQPGERRPVVVCQHGRNGVPRDTLDANNPAYNNFAAALAERGFITFAPHNLYRGEDRYRWLSRKANTVQATLFSFIIAQHDQILRWLQTQPFVDGRRMAFYGLSYGGETAMRVPTILEDYALSICSGDFNQWTRKVAATDQPWSFMKTIEWEMPYWNLGHTFDYAEMGYLMVPRPFMVERGHHDRVGRDGWVAHEYGKLAWLYAQLGLANRTEIEYFQGGHSINGERTFDFLHRHLDWPKR